MTKPASAPTPAVMTIAIIATVPVVLGYALFAASGARADYVITIAPSDSNVVETSNGGNINTTGLTELFPGISSPTTQIFGPNSVVGLSPVVGFTSRWTGGPAIQPIGTALNSFTPQMLTGTSTFSFTGLPSTGATNANLFLPGSCMASAECSIGPATATYVNETINSMGLIPGTYISSWGTNDQSITINVVPGPVVGAGLPGLIAGLGGLVAMARRRRKQLA